MYKIGSPCLVRVANVQYTVVSATALVNDIVTACPGRQVDIKYISPLIYTDICWCSIARIAGCRCYISGAGKIGTINDYFSTVNIKGTIKAGSS